jgi:hypothetical protein
MLKASSKSSPDVISRNVVSAFDHSLSSAADRFAHIWNPDNMQLDSVVLPLSLDSSANVSCRSINPRTSLRRSFPALNATVRSQWRQSARDFVSM